jgi:phosphoglycolate/pyridoxal phosphate phosphatase family enzyme
MKGNRTRQPVRALLLDLDGVVYLGPNLIPGVKRSLLALAGRGVKLFYVTNNSTLTREGFAKKLRAFGLPCPASAVMNAAFASARIIRTRHGRGAHVLVVGEHGLPAELRSAGLVPSETRTRAEWEAWRKNAGRIRAVVTSFDRTLTYWKLCAALDSLNAGAELVATNMDPTWPSELGVMPGTGALVSLLAYASGKKPFLVGKPDPLMFKMLLRENGMSPRETLVIGDRLDVDVEAGRRLGARTAIVLTGLTSHSGLARSRIKPDFVLRKLDDLLKPGFAALFRDPRG